ncbi:MAG TPA: carboxypeptidase regulatory-like domain-containing protein [Bryobacteraceae bacterium]|nr:carboxypeptidase regulatory-like domain-containing protein [Bryobacteraceae bacterium]
MRNAKVGLSLLVLLAGSPALVWSQQNSATPPPAPEIRGIVLEPETNQPVGGAEVLLSIQQAGPIRFNGGWQPDEARKIRTDETGAFRITLDKPGPYRVEAKKPGYAAPEESGARAYAEVALTADKPVAEPRLFLARPGEVGGSVVDEDTGKPLVKFRLYAVRKRGWRGFWLHDGRLAVTDAEGKFTVTGLSPGEYAVEIGPQGDPAKRVMTKFKTKETEAVDRDYELTYWPGGHGQDAALPVIVSPGGSVNVGELRVKKVLYHRVHVRVPVSNCEPGDTMHLTEWVKTSQGGLSSGILASVPCGKDVLVTGFPPGTYRLMLAIDGRTLETRGTASITFSIAEDNIAIDAPLVAGVPVDGAFVAADGAALPDLSKLRVWLAYTDFVGSSGEESPSPQSDGRFRFKAVRALEQTVVISGLDSGHYIKEIRYNGIPLAGNVAPFDKPAATHSLIIVVDDKPATIVGSVVSDGKPVPEAFVFAVKWPLDFLGLNRPSMARGDKTGHFQIPGLAPGEYRVTAVSADYMDRAKLMDIPNSVVQRVLEAGKKIEVGLRGFQNVELVLTELR